MWLPRISCSAALTGENDVRSWLAGTTQFGGATKSPRRSGFRSTPIAKPRPSPASMSKIVVPNGPETDRHLGTLKRREVMVPIWRWNIAWKEWKVAFATQPAKPRSMLIMRGRLRRHRTARGIPICSRQCNRSRLALFSLYSGKFIFGELRP
jgi:hypothetical protein